MMQVFFKPEAIRRQRLEDFRTLSSEMVIESLDQKPIMQIEDELLLDKILSGEMEV